MIITGIRMVLFFFSAFGWWELLRHRIRVHPGFYPGLAVAAQSAALLAGGLLNMLLETAVLLFAAGMISGICYAVREKSWREYLRGEYLFLLLLSAASLVYLRGKVFTHYDNFSHWAVVVQSLLEENRLPNFASANITFREYPMGSTVWVYYFARMTGASEPLQMFAQTYMMLCCMLPLMKTERRFSWPALLLMLFAANMLLALNVGVTELLVDTLLPLAGMCGVLLMLEWKGRAGEGVLPTAVFLIWLIQIKASAVFFVLAAAVPLLMPALRERKLPAAAGSLLAAFFSLYLWKRHCAYVYPAEIISKHAFSLAGWRMTLETKSLEDIKHIILELARYAVSWPGFGGMILALGGTGMGCLILNRRNLRRFGRLAGAAALLYAAWQAGLLITYVFSMPRGEAFSLASINRYEKTILIAVVYLCWRELITAVSRRQKAGLSFLAAGVMGAASLGILGLSGGELFAFRYRPYRIGRYDGLEAREWLERMKEEYHLPPEGKYAMLIEDWDSEYFYYLGCYVFPRASGIAQISQATEADLDRVKDYCFLVRDAENPAIQSWVAQHAPEQAGRELIVPEPGE